MFLFHKLISGFFLFCLAAWSCQPAYAQTIHDGLRSCNFNPFKIAPPANNFELDGINNSVVNPALMKDKVIILNFWKIDCAACSMEKPLLEKLARKYSDRGLEIIAVNLFDRASDIIDYIKKNDFPFTYAFDTHQRYTVNQKRLPSGIPTTFVVNSDSEAIYEIPGLPTTYVIDRTGRVVGYSVGLVNWDNKALTSYIESLLAPLSTTIAHASDIPFSADARQGTSLLSGPTRTGPKKKNSGEPSVLSAPETPDIPNNQADSGVAPSLPFQSTNQTGTDAGSGARPDTQADEFITVKTEKPPKEKNKSKTKQEKSATNKSSVEYAKPKPFSQSKSKIEGSSDYPVYQSTPGSPKPSLGTPSASDSGYKDKNLPPLPAAMPYSPPNRSSRSIAVKPDETGSVVARFPGASPSSPIGRGTGNLPDAQPLGPGNTIGVSIMDSFGKHGDMRTTEKSSDTAQTDATPPSSVLGQFTQDIQNLGAGIRDTFGYLIPKGR